MLSQVYKNHGKNMLLSIDRSFGCKMSDRLIRAGNGDWCCLCGARQWTQVIPKDLYATRLRVSAARVWNGCGRGSRMGRGRSRGGGSSITVGSFIPADASGADHQHGSTGECLHRLRGYFM